MLLPWMFYIVSFFFNASILNGLLAMTTWQIHFTVLVAVADEKQVSTYTEHLRKMGALMRRQTTPVR